MNKLEYILPITMSILTFLVGGFDSLIISLLIIIGIDYITGVLKAIYKKNLNCITNLKGVLKKIGYLLIVILATVIDGLILDDSMALRSLVLYFFIANESISVVDNWGEIGLPLPEKLKSVLKKMKEDGS